MKLPSIRLPSFKRRPKEAAPEGPDPLAETPPDQPSGGNRLRHIATAVSTGVLAVLVIGGTGAMVGWLMVNAETTEARRMLERPQLTVPILADGEAPTPNSSANAMPAAVGGHDAKAAGDGHGADPHAAAKGTDAEHPAPHGATAEAGHGTGKDAAPHGAEKSAEPAMPPLPPPADGVRLAAVDPTLLETKDDAKLPKIGQDGRQPWSTYSRPFNLDDSRPRIAVVIVGLGLAKETTEQAIVGLPGAISLSFSPYSKSIGPLMSRARQAGHETLIDLPMEPLDFPRDDPGPSTLLTSLSLVDNLNRLEWLLGRATGYVGMTTWMGSQFTTVEDALMPVLEGLKQRGLMLVDSRATSRSIATELASSIQLPRAFNNTFIDSNPSVDTIDRALAGLEAIARQQRYAVGIARPLPVTLDRLSRWTHTLEGKGFALAPVSAVADRQRLR